MLLCRPQLKLRIEFVNLRLLLVLDIVHFGYYRLHLLIDKIVHIQSANRSNPGKSGWHDPFRKLVSPFRRIGCGNNFVADRLKLLI